VGLDVYVGSLARYYSREWETVVERYSREHGIPHTTIYADQVAQPEQKSFVGRLKGLLKGGAAAAPPKPQFPSWDLVAEAVPKWQGGFARALDDPGFAWDDSREAPYFTDKPGWDGHGGLVLLAAYDEHPEATPPESLPAEWGDDRVLQDSAADRYGKTRYRQIIAPQVWLPFEADTLLQFPFPGFEEALTGSSVALLAQLRELNGRTLRLDPGDTDWDMSVSEFDKTARMGLSIFLDLAGKAVAHRLPMVLDG